MQRCEENFSLLLVLMLRGKTAGKIFHAPVLCGFGGFLYFPHPSFCSFQALNHSSAFLLAALRSYCLPVHSFPELLSPFTIDSFSCKAVYLLPVVYNEMKAFVKP